MKYRTAGVYSHVITMLQRILEATEGLFFKTQFLTHTSKILKTVCYLSPAIF